jgi:AMMECR1 domain-containing protein
MESNGGTHGSIRHDGGARPGTDGVVIERGGRRGLLLPEVAAQLGNDRVEFLEITCRKAGLPTRAWRDSTTIVYAFRTHRFGGRALA